MSAMGMPRALQAVGQLAHVCLAQGRGEDAAALYQWLAEQLPQDRRVRQALVLALLDAGRVREAAEVLRALGPSANDAVAQYLLGRVYGALGDSRAKVALQRYAKYRRGSAAFQGAGR